MKKRFTILIALMFSYGVFAQGGAQVSGVVTANGEALPGANVIVKGLSVGAATDIEGKYSFTIPEQYLDGREAVLSAKYVGYKEKSVTITLTEKSIVQNFDLEEDVFRSEEIVVTGLASKTSKSVAEVAVSKIDAAGLTNMNPYTSMSQLVGGKIAGVQMTPASGNVGGGFRFFVRSGGGLNGDEQPVIYVDGVRIDNTEIEGRYTTGGQGNSTLANLNPDDIASIEVLKGPAGAAMYGTSGSNGVVLITTKSGKLAQGKADNLQIAYKHVYGYNTQATKYKKEDFVSADDANRIFIDGLIRQNNLSVAGGSAALRYYTSFDNRYEEGILPNNYMDRNSLKANISAYPSDKVKLQFNGGYTFADYKRPYNDNSILGFLGNTLLYYRSWMFTDSASVMGLEDLTHSKQFTGNVQATYNPIHNLEVNFSAGIDATNYRMEQTYPVNLNYSTADDGQRSLYNRENNQYTYDVNARYYYNIVDGLKGNSVVGAQIFNRKYQTSYQQTQVFGSYLIKDIGSGTDATDYGEYFEHTREAGIFTEHSFSYVDQYFLSLGLRNDYASSIGSEAPSILYPKASFALRLDKYDFFPTETIGLFKLRAAYGENGQLPNFSDAVDLLWTSANGGYGGGAILSSIGNPEIEPERIKELEFGFEAEFLTNYSIEFTYYKQYAENSIIGKELAPSTGKTATSIPYNVGAVESWGIESLIQATPLRTANYELNLSLIWNYQTNEVTDLGGAQPIYDGNGDNVIKEGLPKHEFYALKVTGARFDENGEYAGVVVSPEPVDLGNPIPDHTGSFTVNFRFLKNFSLYAMADWGLNNKMLNMTRLYATIYGNNKAYNDLETQLMTLAPGTAEYIDAANKYAKMSPNYDGNFVEDADYFKIREVSLSYSFADLLPTFYVNNYIRDIVVGFSARNIYTSTKYSGPDVEVNFDGSRSLSRGIDFLTLQNPKSYSFFVRVGI
jgi:TonB-dependent SusC/RagA subfamily outer membrane receptor